MSLVTLSGHFNEEPDLPKLAALIEASLDPTPTKTTGLCCHSDPCCVTMTAVPSPCELSCLAKGQRFYYNFGRVLDGTKCEAGSNGVCINGQCLAVGCGAILGSELKEDVCGVCGGRNNTCQRFQSVFITPHLPPGSLQYNEVTTIPAGATYIKVTDKSSNYLALQNRDYKYIINGNLAINWPGTYTAAGTKVHYRRSADHRESLEAIGPTKEDLHLMVLSMEQASGINYEYWLPNDQYRLYHGDHNVLRGAHHAVVHTSHSFSRASPIEATTLAMTTTPISGGFLHQSEFPTLLMLLLGQPLVHHPSAPPSNGQSEREQAFCYPIGFTFDYFGSSHFIRCSQQSYKSCKIKSVWL
ncbi:ADAMTS-like protein 5 [Rhincodon typus]|uniref:ADAMTS-like protein 5 n=1 Tax=Rhincodon typus TaxID=259920 RepID=UPI00202FBD01|nr:ADAMTS-like protein 5 [Rhincodon typus]